MRLLANLFCRDIDAQARFYAALLGLDERVERRSPIYRAVGVGASELGFNAAPAYALLALADRAPAGTAPAPTTAFFTFMLADPAAVDAAARRIAAAGGRVVKAPYATYYGEWQAVLADPEDNAFRVSCGALPAGVDRPAPPH